jgi:two-component system, response regulator YesN
MSVYRIHAARASYVIEKKYADASLTVRSVAQLIGLSTQHLCRVLKRERGLTFAELLRGVRLREAKRLLRESSCSMKEIAFRVGFRHPSQFTRAFRGECGMSPSQYRARELAGDVHRGQAM